MLALVSGSLLSPPLGHLIMLCSYSRAQNRTEPELVGWTSSAHVQFLPPPSKSYNPSMVVESNVVGGKKNQTQNSKIKTKQQRREIKKWMEYL